MHPLTGSWKANLAKSHRHANHQFQSAKMHFDIQGHVVVMKHAGVNMSGKEESATMTLQADGVEYPITQAPGLASLSQFLGTHALETIGKRGETVLGHGTYAVSEDGQTMTATVKGVDAQGAAFEQVIVFDRD